MSTQLPRIGFIIAAHKNESVPWHKAFPEIYEEDSRPVCIRALRRRERLTQKEFAARADIQQSHISMMKSGKMQTSIQQARELRKALNAGC